MSPKIKTLYRKVKLIPDGLNLLMDKRKTLIEKSIGKCLYNHRLRRDVLMPKQNRNYKKKLNGIKIILIIKLIYAYLKI